MTRPTPRLLPRPWRPIALALLLSAPLAARAADGTEQRWQAAQHLYGDCHWREAYALLAGLADEGHADAARIALLMASHGPRLYGERLPPPGAERRERWLSLQRLPGEATQLASDSGATR